MHKSPKWRSRTFQESHRTVETFRAQLVITERAQQFGDEDIRLFRNRQRSHIAMMNLNGIAPLQRFPLF